MLLSMKLQKHKTLPNNCWWWCSFALKFDSARLSCLGY